jgi:hypothetical protein
MSIDTRELLLSMTDCFTTGRKAIYCSSELTTGLRLYAAMRERGVTDRHALGKEFLRDSVYAPNAQAANEFAAKVEALRRYQTISPACLFVPDWGQHDYLAFWETLIKTRVSEVWFNKNWEWSNGCTFEYAAARQAGLPTFDAEGRPLAAPEAAILIRRAIDSLKADGMDARKLEEHLSSVPWTIPQLD